MGAHTRCAADERERLGAALDAECVGLDDSVRRRAEGHLQDLYRRPRGAARVAGELEQATAKAAKDVRRRMGKGSIPEYELVCIELEADHAAKQVLVREVNQNNPLWQGTSRAQHPTSRASGGPPEGNDAD